MEHRGYRTTHIRNVCGGIVIFFSLSVRVSSFGIQNPVGEGDTGELTGVCFAVGISVCPSAPPGEGRGLRKGKKATIGIVREAEEKGN